MTNSRRAGAAATFVLATASALVLAGCTSYGPPYACAEWVPFEDAQAMYEEASFVVEGVVGEATQEIPFTTGPGTEHAVEVEVVHKGAIEPGEILVSSPRDYCSPDSPLPADDPLVEGERVMLYLHHLPELEHQDAWEDIERWTTLTPHAGVEPFPEGAELPFQAG